MSRIEEFTKDILVRKLLGVDSRIDAGTISTRIKQSGQRGAIELQEKLFELINRWVRKSGIEKITIDMDSTVCPVYGKQEGSGKGYNPVKKGQKSYHNLLCFMSQTKMVLNSWFRDGTSYTANGAVGFVQQTLAVLPEEVKQVFVRCDSGFFNGKLFDYLEEKGHEYLVKVKLKNLYDILKIQEWEKVSREISQTSFVYIYARGGKRAGN